MSTWRLRGCILEPDSRRLRPYSLHAKDTAYFEMCDDASMSLSPTSRDSRVGQELERASEMHRAHRLHPIRRASRAVKEERDVGLVLDSLSLGVSVRAADPPLRLSKVMSIFPRFCVKNELDRAIKVGAPATREHLPCLPGRSKLPTASHS